MDSEQQKSILSFLRRCQNGYSDALSIAKYLGLRSANDVLPLLRRMAFQGTITKTVGSAGYQWQVSQSGSPPNCVCGISNGGDAEILHAPAANHQPPTSTRTHGRNRSAGQLQTSDVARNNFSTARHSLPAKQSRHHSNRTVSNITLSCSSNTNGSTTYQQLSQMSLISAEQYCSAVPFSLPKCS